jgi:anti-anti-sigma factor
MSSKYASHWMEREDIGDVTVVRVKVPRNLDEEIARAIFDPLAVLVSEMGRSNLVINLATVETAPSLAIAKLVMLNRRTQAGGGRLALCHLTPTVAGILDTTRLTPLFHIYADEREAVASFAAPA